MVGAVCVRGVVVGAVVGGDFVMFVV